MNYQQFVSAVEVRIKQQVKEGMSVCIQTTMKIMEKQSRNHGQ